MEAADGLILIDTGIGLGDIASPEHRLGRDFLGRVRPDLNADETALRQIIRMGYSARDVRHIVLTHLDRDHAGGLLDFPAAQVHVHRPALHAAMHPASRRDRSRHRQPQWAHGPHWRAHEYSGGDNWFNFQAVRDLPELPSDLLLVPLAGHSTGHTGVAVRTGSGSNERWLLHAGDAYFFHGETQPRRPHCPPGLRLFQRKAQASQRARLANQQRLRELRDTQQLVTVFSAHDPVEFDRLAGNAAG